MSASNAQVCGELWTSLVTLLRSYAATHSVNGGPIRAEVDDEEILLRAAGSWMQLKFDVATGHGRWVMHPDGEARIERSVYLDLDGSLQIGVAEAEPMDLATIEIMSEFAGRAQRAADSLAVLVATL